MLNRNTELAGAVDVMMARAKRIYILMVEVNKFIRKGLYLSVRVFSTVVLIVDTVNKQTNITNRTEIS